MYKLPFSTFLPAVEAFAERAFDEPWAAFPLEAFLDMVKDNTEAVVGMVDLAYHVHHPYNPVAGHAFRNRHAYAENHHGHLK